MSFREKGRALPGFLARSALIAALYALLVLAFAPLSFGPVQFRVAEALTLLPWLFPEAIPGLFVGCLVSNLFGGLGIVDMVFGSLATLVAAWLTRRMPNVFWAAVPPVLINAVVVGTYLSFLLNVPMAATILYIGLGEAGVCFLLGIPLVTLLTRVLNQKKTKA
ncbi:MAG: QueT transporter family protein [Synergistales bacterium]